MSGCGSKGHKSLTCQAMQSKGNWWPLINKLELDAYLRMARLHNTLPALLLVLVGAWAGAGRSPAVLTKANVWAMAFISAGVSAASMLINDYFDWLSGTDQVNAPDKPLPSGQAKPDVAVLLAGGMYVAVLMAACLMEQPAVRGIVAFSAGATLLYTPLFKRVTILKNALVASVIALAVLGGAIAAGSAGPMLERVAAPTWFAFTGVMYREILMDCTDEPGDRAAHVHTLPVMMGPGAAVAVACALLIIGGVSGCAALLGRAAALSAGLPPGSTEWIMSGALPNVLCTGLLVAGLIKILRQAAAVVQSEYSLEALSRAVDGCLKPIGLSIIMLAALA